MARAGRQALALRARPWGKGHVPRQACCVLLAALALAAPAASQPDQMTEVWNDWTVQCQTLRAETDAAPVRLCEMVQDLRAPEGGQRVLGLSLRPQDPEGSALLSLVVPFGLNLRDVIGLSVDGANVVALPFDTCLPQGCLASAPLDPSALEALKRGASAVVSLPTRGQAPLALTVSLTGFTAAWTRLGEF
jgi:invasion protein IalB